MDNILFYSNKCEYSKKILNLINDIDDISSYKLICIDNNKNFKFIQRVPTLLIGEKKPLVGVNAFKWINAKNQFNKRTNNINLDANSNLDINLNSLLSNSEDKNFNDNNTSIYSYIDDKKDINMSLNNSNKIFTLPEGDKINNKLQKRKLNKLINLRSKQDVNTINDVNTEMSSEPNINNEINKINFAVNPSSQKLTTNVESLGISASYSKINKGSINV
tara:strand:+ start:524 stop:1180 length:657 start_codon:yes stop_codon:yes gene_type:complete